jgi:hypothetical protein
MSEAFARVRLLAALVLLGASACAAGSQPFLHRAHRENYALQPAELERAQFYVSEDVLAHELGDAGTPLPGPEHVFMVHRGTRGAVTDAGPDWLRVSFGTGPGALFLANPEARPDSVYLLASEGEAGQQPRLVRDDPDKRLRAGTRRFQVIYGASARLLIDDGDLEKLIEARPHLPGRKAE